MNDFLIVIHNYISFTIKIAINYVFFIKIINKIFILSQHKWMINYQIFYIHRRNKVSLISTHSKGYRKWVRVIYGNNKHALLSFGFVRLNFLVILFSSLLSIKKLMLLLFIYSWLFLSWNWLQKTFWHSMCMLILVCTPVNDVNFLFYLLVLHYLCLYLVSSDFFSFILSYFIFRIFTFMLNFIQWK